MSLHNLEDAFYEELRDVLSAEKQITRALKKMIKKASNEHLKEAFEEHLEQTDGQIARLEQVFETLGRPARSRHCDAMAGILEEGKSAMEDAEEADVLDAMMIAGAQKVEHYEIASYGTLCAWAKLLGHNDAAKLLQQTLTEEKETDEKLTRIATEVNQHAETAAS